MSVLLLPLLYLGEYAVLAPPLASEPVRPDFTWTVEHDDSGTPHHVCRPVEGERFDVSPPDDYRAQWRWTYGRDVEDGALYNHGTAADLATAQRRAEAAFRRARHRRRATTAGKPGTTRSSR